MQNNNVAISYLRAFITMLVVAHHAILAYATFAPHTRAPFLSPPYDWAAFPVIDTQRWRWFDLFALFNDTFFMSLMFLLAGLFVASSVTRKGFTSYLKARGLRLALPWAIGIALLSPLVYYPSYLLSGAEPGVAPYLQQWFALPFWSPGPCWFIAVLLGLDILAVLLYRFAPRAMEAAGGWCSGAAQRPDRLFLGLVLLSFIALLPMVFAFGERHWFAEGPLVIQASRILHYPVYFFAGVAIGAWGLERGLLARDGLLAQRWRMWAGVALVAFGIRVAFVLKTMAPGQQPSTALTAAAILSLAFACAAISFFLLAVFVRFANRRIPVLDNFSSNAYGVYIVHYAFIAWTQYLVLGAPLPAVLKGALVFGGTLFLSWGAIAAIRRIGFVDQVLSGTTKPGIGQSGLPQKPETTASR